MLRHVVEGGLAVMVVASVHACTPAPSAIDAAAPIDAARPDAGPHLPRDAAWWDGGPDGAAPVDADLAFDASWPDAAYDCTGETTGTPCTADAGVDTCPQHYECDHGSCIPWMRGCGSPVAPCGSPPIPLTWRESVDDGGVEIRPASGCHCFSAIEAYCLSAADPHWR